MFTNFAEFFVCVKEARFSFNVIWTAIVSLCTSVVSNPDIVEIWGGITSFYDKYSVVFRWVLFAGCFVIAFFGKKILSVLKFSFFFVLGFALGVYFLMPIFPESIVIPAWIVGIIVGIVAAVLYRFLYVGVSVVILGYSAYMLCYHGLYINGPTVDYTTGRALISLVIAIAAVIIVLFARKYVEMVGTAVLGGWLATLTFVKCIYDYNMAIPFLAENWWLGMFIPAAIIAAVGIVVQVRTRKRW